MSPFDMLTREALLAEVALTLMTEAPPDDADLEAWSECLEEAWPRDRVELRRASAWAIVGRLSRSGAVRERAHALRAAREVSP